MIPYKQWSKKFHVVYKIGILHHPTVSSNSSLNLPYRKVKVVLTLFNKNISLEISPNCMLKS
jgi:hypothetical protein